ncbi:MAG: peptidylprolyl isomerase [Flavobacteriaceae bacterium]|nr:peptidylprolyl isomerase [Flavobacteriaceae bacterium]|tara:strand:- start:3376 stop:4089 length:714 start_codon:yes stop_codon:yes gene_type:complete
MFFKKNKNIAFIIIIILFGCNYNNSTPKKNKIIKKNKTVKNISNLKNEAIKKSENFFLNEKNAIPFFYEYEKENKENKIKIITSYGDIEIELFKNTPYHRANFIYLIKKKYFNNTTFHRVVKDFIIQGGNSDSYEISKKRTMIGKYLLPPDTKKGYSHNRGILSMPSSEIDNPHKLASPYEFFIVVQKPGAYHLDGDYTAFGKVIKGMDVVDRINKEETDKRESPIHNIYMKMEIIQ